MARTLFVATEDRDELSWIGAELLLKVAQRFPRTGILGVAAHPLRSSPRSSGARPLLAKHVITELNDLFRAAMTDGQRNELRERTSEIPTLTKLFPTWKRRSIADCLCLVTRDGETRRRLYGADEG